MFSVFVFFLLQTQPVVSVTRSLMPSLPRCVYAVMWMVGVFVVTVKMTLTTRLRPPARHGFHLPESFFGSAESIFLRFIRCDTAPPSLRQDYTFASTGHTQSKARCVRTSNLKIWNNGIPEPLVNRWMTLPVLHSTQLYARQSQGSCCFSKLVLYKTYYDER